MSFIETPPQTGYPDEFSDEVAKMTASILQEQLAPIVETLREHARLLDLHSALLNHSTAINRYNVGKIDDIRDFQNNINFKLQFYAHPEDRWHPNYRNPRTPSASTSTETLLNAESRLPPPADAHTQADEPNHSTAASSSSVAASPRFPDRSSTPAATEHADSRPTTPRQQQLGDGFSVVPGPSRRLQRERPFSVAPDPMWNSSREIQPYEPLATHAPPPPYVLPPTYSEVMVPPGQNEAVEHVVVRSESPLVETIDIEPETLRSPTLEIIDVSVSSGVFPLVPVTEVEEAHNEPSHSLGPSWTFSSTSLAQNPPIASEDLVEAEEAEHSATTSENETDDHVGSGDEEDSNVEPPLSEKARGKRRMREEDYPTQLSEKARGKKRMREEDYELDDKDDSETLGHLLGEGCSSGSASRARDGQPDRKRMKTDTERDTRINTDPLEDVDETVSMVGRMLRLKESTAAETWRQVKKLKEIEKLHRSGRRLLA